MFIISCILSITKMSNKDLAEYVSITEDSIKNYLKGEEIPKKIRERFATIFSFPVFYFDVDTSKDEYFKKLIHGTIKKEWEENKPKKYRLNITDDMIIDSLLNGYDFITNEKFDDEHILNNSYIKKFLNKVFSEYKNTNNKYDEIIGEEEATDTNNNIYDRLVSWRALKSKQEGLRESMIISDKVLNNILESNINEKEDLLKVSGIGLATFGKYGDDIFEIIKEKDKINLEIIDV